MRKFISLALVLIMAAGLLPTIIQTVTATDGIAYIEANGVTQICTDYTPYTGQTTLTGGWYVVSGEQTPSDRIAISGDVHIIQDPNFYTAVSHNNHNKHGLSFIRRSSITVFTATGAAELNTANLY